MPYDIKCHKVWQYGYQKNRIDQTNWSMGHWALRIEKNEAKNAKNLNVNFSYVFSFVILKCKIAKEDAIFEKSLFCEKFLEYDFTWKNCWFQIEIQNFILMTRPNLKPNPSFLQLNSSVKIDNISKEFYADQAWGERKCNLRWQ